MDKREENKLQDTINKKNNTNKFLLITLIILFFITLYISIQYIIKYQVSKMPDENEQIIEIKTKETNATIINNGVIEKKIDNNTFASEKEVIIENINAIEMISNNNDHSSIKFDVKYNISKNDFKENDIANNNSEVLVRFSYSFDNKNWTYVNNVISTSSSNISPLIGNTYDIAGLVTDLKVATNYELSSNNKSSAIMFWRSETIFKDMKNNNNNKELKANFIIEYKSN